MGWVGVDLFFVLSGFLVAGLLFKEFQENGNVNATRFLTRRSYKILPLFYLFMVMTFVLRLLLNEGFALKETLGELLFLRNYTGGYWVHTWSLSVEQHFYFLLVAGVTVLIKKQLLGNRQLITRGFLLMFILFLAARILNIVMERHFGVHAFFGGWARYAQTHYRLDSLLAGTLIAYYFYLHRPTFDQYTLKLRKYLLPIFALMVIPAFIFDPLHWIMATIGYSMLYVGFGSLLIYFISNSNIQQQLQNRLGKLLFNSVAYCGMCSYPIYLWQIMVREYLVNRMSKWVPLNSPAAFLIYIALSLVVGIILFKYVETYFTRIRANWQPRWGFRSKLTGFSTVERHIIRRQSAFIRYFYCAARLL